MRSSRLNPVIHKVQNFCAVFIIHLHRRIRTRGKKREGEREEKKKEFLNRKQLWRAHLGIGAHNTLESGRSEGFISRSIVCTQRASPPISLYPCIPTVRTAYSLGEIMPVRRLAFMKNARVKSSPVPTLLQRRCAQPLSLSLSLSQRNESYNLVLLDGVLAFRAVGREFPV